MLGLFNSSHKKEVLDLPMIRLALTLEEQGNWMGIRQTRDALLKTLRPSTQGLSDTGSLTRIPRIWQPNLDGLWYLNHIRFTI